MVSGDTFISVCLTYLSVYFSVLCQSVFLSSIHPYIHTSDTYIHLHIHFLVSSLMNSHYIHGMVCKNHSIQIAGSNLYFVQIYSQKDAAPKANLIKITQFPLAQEITDSWLLSYGIIHMHEKVILLLLAVMGILPA